jgi:DNA (cytosine-5)-methyltransferase 1
MPTSLKQRNINNKYNSTLFPIQYPVEIEKIDPSKTKLDVWDKLFKVEENGYYWHGDPIYKKGTYVDNKKPIIVELFSGCGGTSLGFEMAGYHALLGCDIHQPSIETFSINHPQAFTILGDVKKVNPSNILELLNGREIDVLIAGVPCQGFSLNNRKRHFGDERNLLYKEFIRFIETLKPKAILLENVSGMKSTGDFVKTIEKDISKAGNMIVKSKLLYAADYGVPQKRTRLVFVGVRGKEFNFSDIKKTHGPGTKKPFVTIKDAIGDLPSLQPDEIAEKYIKKPFCEYQKLMRKNLRGDKLTNHKAPNHPQDTIDKIRNTKPGLPMYPKFKQRIRLAWDIQSPTQVSGGIRPQFQFGHPSDPRGLTIRERCRIQSFPDNFVVSGGIVQSRVQTGNAVPPFLAKAIALALKSYL